MAGFTFPSNFHWYKICPWSYRYRHWDYQLLPVASVVSHCRVGNVSASYSCPKSQESHQTPDSGNSSKQQFCYFYKMCTEYTPVNKLQGFSRRNIAWAALLKLEVILIKESLLPLPAEVVSSLAHMPVKCLLWKQRCELGFSAHKTGSEEAKSAKFAGGSRNHHWAAFPGKVGGKSLNLQMQTSDFEICRSTGNGL